MLGHGYFNIVYLLYFDPCVLFCCLVFCSVSSSTERERPNRSQVVRIELHCISELYSSNLRAVGPSRSVEDETEQKTRQENKTQGSKQGK